MNEFYCFCTIPIIVLYTYSKTVLLTRQKENMKEKENSFVILLNTTVLMAQRAYLIKRYDLFKSAQ